ncbi:hypothetical protein CDAR_497261 [Caerostris darwini]|uniref:Uncharacterized protein n=1 Tax=Caerostris darwini TaxID=1538125 RepID=A0AAV4RZ40_9ARAC|nr:hypothetical protein CDAR_497261 [Caerostris darwini]
MKEQLKETILHDIKGFIIKSVTHKIRRSRSRIMVYLIVSGVDSDFEDEEVLRFFLFKRVAFQFWNFEWISIFECEQFLEKIEVNVNGINGKNRSSKKILQCYYRWSLKCNAQSIYG